MFPCERWLDTNEDDNEVVRELPANGELIPEPLPRMYSICTCIHLERPKSALPNVEKNVMYYVFLFCSDQIQSNSLHGDNRRQRHRCIRFSKSNWRPGGHRRSAAGQLQKQHQQVWERKCGYILYIIVRHGVQWNFRRKTLFFVFFFFFVCFLGFPSFLFKNQIKISIQSRSIQFIIFSVTHWSQSLISVLLINPISCTCSMLLTVFWCWCQWWQMWGTCFSLIMDFTPIIRH